MNANDQQVGGDHYKTEFQHWDLVNVLIMPYFPAQITRYVARWRKKNGVEDLNKALHYINKMIEIETLVRKHCDQLLDNFYKANDLTEDEALVFNMLSHYQMGDMDRLTEAQGAIVRMLDDAVPKDPEFREPRDEWKSN